MIDFDLKNGDKIHFYQDWLFCDFCQFNFDFWLTLGPPFVDFLLTSVQKIAPEDQKIADVHNVYIYEKSIKNQ